MYSAMLNSGVLQIAAFKAQIHWIAYVPITIETFNAAGVNYIHI